MMTRSQELSRDGTWSVVLAGGEGERTRSFIEKWLGYHKPKQYCAFVGRRSLFQHTVDRADRITPSVRRVVVAAQDHRSEVFQHSPDPVPVGLEPRQLRNGREALLRANIRDAKE